MSIDFLLIALLACGSPTRETSGPVITGDAFSVSVVPVYRDEQAGMLEEIDTLQLVVTQGDGERSTLGLLGNTAEGAPLHVGPPCKNRGRFAAPRVAPRTRQAPTPLPTMLPTPLPLHPIQRGAGELHNER